MLAAFVAAGGLALGACEKPDASATTSPSALALLGTTTGAVVYAPPGSPPPDVAPPSGWEFELANVRYAKLENEERSLQVVAQLQSRPGPGMELWMTGPDGNVFEWSGGSARRYDGVFCFQLRLEDDDEALSLPEGQYHFTMAFRDPGTNEVVAAKTVTVAGFPHTSTKAAPAEGSSVAKDLLGCPRTVI